VRNIKPRFKKLYGVISPFKSQALVLFIVTLLAAGSEVIGLSLIMPFLGIAIKGEVSHGMARFLSPVFNLWPNVDRLIVVMFLLFFFILAKSVLMVYQVYLRSNFVWKLNERWNNIIMSKYLNGTFSYFVNQKQGVLLHNVLQEPGLAARALLQLIQFITKLTLLLALLVLLILTDWRIAVSLVILGMFVVYPFMGITRKYSSDRGTTKIKLSQDLSANAAESILGFLIVKAFSLGPFRLRSFREINQRMRKLRIQMDVVRALPAPAGETFIVAAVVLLSFFITSMRSFDFKSFLPMMGMLVVVSQRLLTNASFLVSHRMMIYHTLPSLSLVHRLIMEDIEQEDIESGIEFEGLRGDIQFKNVDFSYDSAKPVFANLNLTIFEGKMIAISGRSGIGKSTIVGLLMGFLKPTHGEILVNNRSLQEYSLKSWRSRLGYVSQDIVIFNTSIKENIRMGKVDANDEDIERAVKKAAIHDFINTLPKGYDTKVGDRGMKLSGGQKQRIAIARAILRDPDIYIFDEATSSLDNESEKRIQKSIEELSKEKTVFVIAHRLSTIENVDVVYDLGQMQSVCLCKDA